PTLIKADPKAARGRMPELQAVCERVPLHTDKRETRGAWSRWWTLLAKVDPVGLVDLVVPELLAECNDSNWLLNDALQEVWREWHRHVEPLIAGAMRLTLDTPLEAADAEEFERLAAGPAGPAARRLLIWLLARADERPVAYSYSNSDEMVA